MVEFLGFIAFLIALYAAWVLWAACAMMKDGPPLVRKGYDEFDEQESIYTASDYGNGQLAEVYPSDSPNGYKVILIDQLNNRVVEEFDDEKLSDAKEIADDWANAYMDED